MSLDAGDINFEGIALHYNNSKKIKIKKIIQGVNE